VLGIIVLAIVIGLSKSAGSGEEGVDWGQIGVIAAKAFGIWLGTTALLIVLAKSFKRFLGIFKGEGTVPGIALGVALIVSGIMESAGLAMIIGAYCTGLALAKEQDLAHRLERALRPIYNILVPVFFCCMGMLVDFGAMSHALVFGLVFSVVAIVFKVIGCGLPTFLVKFNMRGALRIGFGMLPRGEVALIIAGVGLSNGIIQSDMFGVAIMMTLVTTVMAPPILMKVFDGGPGIRGVVEVAPPAREVVWRLEVPSTSRLEIVTSGIVGAIRLREGYSVAHVSTSPNVYLVSSSADEEGTFDFQIVQTSEAFEVHSSAPDRERALNVVRDAIVYAKSTYDTLIAMPS